MIEFRISPVKNTVFTTALDVRIYDINYGNHLGNDAFVSLVHEARVQFLKCHGYTELNVHGVGMLVTKLAVIYLGEAFHGDKLVFNIGIGDHTKTSVELFYQATAQQTEKEIARAITLLTFYDYKNGIVAKVPEEFLALAGSSST